MFYVFVIFIFIIVAISLKKKKTIASLPRLRDKIINSVSSTLKVIKDYAEYFGVDKNDKS